METFLGSIARYFAAGRGTSPGGDTVFVVPNKRSLLFLKEEYKAAMSQAFRSGRGPKVVRMPRFQTIQEFIGGFAGVPAADPRELVFILYRAYLKVIASPGQRPPKRDFESFVFWGNIILGDFDDVDRAMVNARELFTNLRRVSDIKAYYLNERQIRAIESVWGSGCLRIDDSADSGHARFWKHVGYDSDEPKKAMNRSFAQFWQILFEIYEAYHEELAAREVTSPGMQFRLAAERVDAMADEDFGSGHYVFVGFNDLSHAETLIFKRLQSSGRASFFWDTAPLHMFGSADDGRTAGAPLERVSRLARTFAMPADFTPSLPESLPEIILEAVPSNVVQAKALNKWLADNLEDFRLTEKGVLTTAVVLPDAGLLLPTVMSVPRDVKALNITMGLSYRSTTFASMLHSIVRLHLNASVSADGVVTFYYKDILNLLQQPHIKQIARREAQKLAERIASGGMMRVGCDVLQRDTEVLHSIFEPVVNFQTVADVTEYLIGLLSEIRTALENSAVREADSESGEEDGKKRTIKFFETDAIAFFRNEITEYGRLLAEYGIDLSGRKAAKAVFRIFERLFSHRGLSVNGTPVEGLQILGVLETRSLDFENVAVLSMNEGVFPRVSYTRTMIPATLRTCFHLPDFQSLEWTYAYCFYRLVARARRVALFYDSRSEGPRGGEESRYIHQLANLVPGLKINAMQVVFPPASIAADDIRLPKDDAHMAGIDKLRYTPGVTRPRLSASAIETYKSCGLRFYLQYVMGIRGEDELTPYVGAAQLGTVVHRSIQLLFEREGRGCVISRSTYDRWLAPGTDIILHAVERTLATERHGDPGFRDFDAEERLLIRATEEAIREDLAAERDFYCAGGEVFTYLGSEMSFEADADGNGDSDSARWRIDDSLVVRFTMSVDRVDRLSDGSLRFIDFKTGSDETALPDVSRLIDRGETRFNGLLQLLIYCDAYLSRVDSGARIKPIIHSIRNIALGKPLRYAIDASDNSYNAVMDGAGYREAIHGLVRSIFDRDGELTQAEDEAACNFCHFKAICGRFPRTW